MYPDFIHKYLLDKHCSLNKQKCKYLPLEYLLTYCRNEKCMNVLMSHGGDLNLKDKEGKTIVMNAFINSNIKKNVMLNLIPYMDKIDFSLKDNKGNTLFHILFSYNLIDTVKTFFFYLIKSCKINEIKFNTPNNNAESLLYLSLFHGLDFIISQIAELGNGKFS